MVMKDKKSASLFQKEQVVESLKQSFVKLMLFKPSEVIQLLVPEPIYELQTPVDPIADVSRVSLAIRQSPAE